MLMSLFRWQSRILNKIYRTEHFSKLQEQGLSDPQLIDYSEFFKAANLSKYHNLDLQIIEAANKLCKQSTKSALMQTEVIRLNNLMRQYSQISNYKQEAKEEEAYKLQHVVIYSCLSKCRIWPKILKSGYGFVPNLIDFYNQFTKDFNGYLDFKFDPIILSQKYTKIMKKVHTKKKDNPELIKLVLDNDAHQIINKILTKQFKPSISTQDLISKITQAEKQIVCDTLNDIVHKNMAVTHIAIKDCSFQFIQFLGAIGADFEALDDQKQTSLFYAIKRADLAILKYLIEDLKVDINAREYQKRTPLYLAAFEGYIEIVDYLYKHGADPELPSKLERTPLSKACYLGNVKVVQYLLSLKVDLLKRDVKGRTALHNAVWGIEGGRDGKRRGHIKLEDSPQSAQLMIKAGHPIDYSDYDGFTPLFSAVSSRANRSLELLIKYGASLSHQTNKQQTCVFIAAKYGHLDTLKILIQKYNCQFVQTDIHGYTPLCASITLPSSDVFIYLCDRHMEFGYPLGINKLLECCLQYDRLENWDYIWQWAGLESLHHKKLNDHLPWLKKNPTCQTEEKKQEQEKKFIKLKYLLKELSQMNFLIPLLKSLKFNSASLKKGAQGIQFEYQVPKMVYPQEQITEDDHQMIADKIGQNSDSKQMNDLVNVKEIDPSRHTNIKATVPTISLKIPSSKEIESQFINFLCTFIFSIFGSQSKFSYSQQLYFLSSLQTSTLQDLLDSFCEHYNHARSSQFIVSTIILLYKLIKTSQIQAHNTLLIRNFEITSLSNERDIIKIITQCESNLTATRENVRKMLMRVVKYRMTGVLIQIYNKLQMPKESIGIRKFNKEQLIEMLLDKSYDRRKIRKNITQQESMEQKQEQKISLIEYCLVNGISDIYVYFKQILRMNKINIGSLDFTNEAQSANQFEQVFINILEVKIPDYETERVEYKHGECSFELEPVEEWVFQYKSIIERLSQKQKYVYRSVLQPDSTQENMNTKFISSKNYKFISTIPELLQMQQQIKQHLIIGLDTEHWGFKHEHFVCSIQISVADSVYIVDPLSAANTHHGNQITQDHIGFFIKQMFNDPNKIKIFHAYENDLRWLNEDYNLNAQEVVPQKLRNIIDTGRIFSCLSGDSKNKVNTVGLKTLGLKYLNYEMSKDFQQADWRIRPLFKEMIEYASIDAEILPFIFIEQMKQKRRLEQEKFDPIKLDDEKSKIQLPEKLENIEKLFVQMFKTKRTFKSRGVGYRIKNKFYVSPPKIQQQMQLQQ